MSVFSGWRGIWAVAAMSVAVSAVLGFAISRQPLLIAPIIIAPMILVASKHLATIALALLVSGPVLFSTIQISGLSLDNMLSIAGLGIALLYAISIGMVPLTRQSIYPIAIAILVAVSGVLNEVNPLFPVIRFISLAVIPWLVHHLSEGKTRVLLVTYSVLGVGALSLLLQPITQYPNPYIVEEGLAITRYGGLFGHPNFACYALAISVLYLLYSNRVSLVTIVYISISLSAILLAGSITALAVMVILCIVLAIYRLKRFVAILVLAIFAMLILGKTVMERLDFLFSGVGSQENSGTWRIGRWREVLTYSEQDRLFGIGYQQIVDRTVDGLGAHSGFIQVFVELGVIGSVIILAATFASWVTSSISVSSVILLTYVALTSLVDPVLIYPSSLCILLVLTSYASKSSSLKQGQNLLQKC